MRAGVAGFSPVRENNVPTTPGQSPWAPTVSLCVCVWVCPGPWGPLRGWVPGWLPLASVGFRLVWLGGWLVGSAGLSGLAAGFP